MFIPSSHNFCFQKSTDDWDCWANMYIKEYVLRIIYNDILSYLSYIKKSILNKNVCLIYIEIEENS